MSKIKIKVRKKSRPAQPAAVEYPPELMNSLIEAEQYFKAGQFNRAETMGRQLLDKDPNFAHAWHLLGLVQIRRSRLEQAVDFFDRALALAPDSPDFHLNKGVALGLAGRLDEARGQYQEAIRLRPDYTQAYYNLGVILKKLGHDGEAVERYRQAIDSDSDFVEARYNLSSLLFEHGDYGGAIEQYLALVRIKPNDFMTHFNLGVAYKNISEFDLAVAHYQEAIRIKPDFYRAFYNLGSLTAEQGKAEEAIAAFSQALSLSPTSGLKIRKALVLPRVYESMDDLTRCRQRLEDELMALSNETLTIDHPLVEIGVSNFLSVYQGLNDISVQRQLAAVIRSAYRPSPLPVMKPDEAEHRKIKIGFISSHFRNHTIGKICRGLIAQLSRERFAVTVFSIGRYQDEISNFIRNSADVFFDLTGDLEVIRQVVIRQKLDVLLFTDIGMDTVTYFLAFSRLAPVQCVTWGHPVTTGIDTVDYFISCDGFETPAGDGHYTERLIRLTSPPAYYYRPVLPDGFQDRSHFNLPGDRHIYICPQSLYKIHPEFDQAMAEILRADGAGLIVLVHGPHKHWSDLLAQRFKQTMPDVADRVNLLPRMAFDDYLSLMAGSDVMLDTFPFGGGNTTYEGLAVGIPIVTWPGQFMRGRMTGALYRKMEMNDCVASSLQEYIDLAVRLGTDSLYREDIHQKIMSNNHLIFEDIQVVRELEDFFKTAVAEASKDNEVD
ncbi:MAG: tetratricopeptide repeat protein [Deltaproteobacteria bacterium]|nr:tetratricopeptide repeat protein [Deltaproteobacteria bacterium]